MCILCSMQYEYKTLIQIHTVVNAQTKSNSIDPVIFHEKHSVMKNVTCNKRLLYFD